MNNALRVLEIITVPVSANGLALYPIRMAEKMDARVQVDFLACYFEPTLQKRIESMGGKTYLAPSRLRKLPAYMRFVAKTVRESGYNVVHVHGNSTTVALDLLAAKRGGAKVRIAHSHNTSCKFKALNVLLRPLFDRIYTMALACGNEAGEWMFRKRPFEIMPNAIDVRAFFPNEAERENVRNELNGCGKCVLMHIGNYSQAKNPLFLMQLMEKLDENHALWMIGDGPLREQAEQYATAHALNNRVVFIPPRNDIARLMQGADALLLPSLFEGFPTVALEAQAAGLETLLSEHVTRKVAFSQDVRFLPLEQEAWLNAIGNISDAEKSHRAKAADEALILNGYDLPSAAKALEERYLNMQ